MESGYHTLRSELSIDKFEERLQQKTRKEKALIGFTSYNFSQEPFCGKFDESTFHLTKNTFWRHLKSIKIIGSYMMNDDKNTIVSYSVKVSKTASILFYLLFILMCVGINMMFILKNVRDYQIYFVVNGWILFMLFFGLVFRRISKFIVNQKFKTVFEIDVKPTDKYGYGNDN